MKTTKEQRKYIEEHYATDSTKEIAELLGLDNKTVTNWASHKNISKINKDAYIPESIISNEDDIKFIKENYMSMTYSEIASVIGLTEKQVRSWICHHMPNRERKKRIINDNYFDKIDNRNKAYWLGFIYADGYISKHIDGKSNNYEFSMQLQSRDRYILEKLNDDLGGNNLVSDKDECEIVIKGISATRHKMSRLRVFSKNIVEGLYKNGIDFNKTKSNIYPIVEDEYFLDFLRGYIDGDGWIYIRENPKVLQVGICAYGNECLEYIKDKLLKDYNITSGVYQMLEHKYSIYITGKQGEKLLDMIYEDANALMLDRKYQKYLRYKMLSQSEMVG